MNQAIKKVFENMGYNILSIAKKSARGPDMHIEKRGLVLRVEIKKATKKSRSYYVHKVEKARTQDELIAIIFNSGYVLVEPMKDHLKSCAPCGSRHFFGLF